MKWEYKTVTVMPKLHISSKAFENDFKPKMDTLLAEAGEDGWELFSIASFDAGLKFLLLFKRSKGE